MKGPGIFLAQFLRDDPPFDRLDSIAGWASQLGYRGVQIPTWDVRVFELAAAAGSKAYCDDLRGKLDATGMVPTELAAHLQGQVLAVHPAYEELFQGFLSRRQASRSTTLRERNPTHTAIAESSDWRTEWPGRLLITPL